MVNWLEMTPEERRARMAAADQRYGASPPTLPPGAMPGGIGAPPPPPVWDPATGAYVHQGGRTTQIDSAPPPGTQAGGASAFETVAPAGPGVQNAIGPPPSSRNQWESIPAPSTQVINQPQRRPGAPPQPPPTQGAPPQPPPTQGAQNLGAGPTPDIQPTSGPPPQAGGGGIPGMSRDPFGDPFGGAASGAFSLEGYRGDRSGHYQGQQDLYQNLLAGSPVYQSGANAVRGYMEDLFPDLRAGYMLQSALAAPGAQVPDFRSYVSGAQGSPFGGGYQQNLQDFLGRYTGPEVPGYDLNTLDTVTNEAIGRGLGAGNPVFENAYQRWYGDRARRMMDTDPTWSAYLDAQKNAQAWFGGNPGEQAYTRPQSPAFQGGQGFPPTGRGPLGGQFEGPQGPAAGAGLPPIGRDSQGNQQQVPPRPRQPGRETPGHEGWRDEYTW